MAVVASYDVASRILARRGAAGSSGGAPAAAGAATGGTGGTASVAAGDAAAGDAAAGAGAGARIIHTDDGITVRSARGGGGGGGGGVGAGSAAARAAAVAVAAGAGGRQWGAAVTGRGTTTGVTAGSATVGVVLSGAAAAAAASPPPRGSVARTPSSATPAGASPSASPRSGPRPPAAAIVHAVRASVLAALERRIHDVADGGGDAAGGGAPPPALEGLDAQAAEVSEFVESVASFGENRSMFLVGPPATGKSSVLRQALSRASAAAVRVVWLEAECIGDDSAALREISRQLAVDVRALEVQARAAAAAVSSSRAASSSSSAAAPAAPAASSSASADDGYDTEEAGSPPALDGVAGGSLNIAGMLAATARARAAAAAAAAESPTVAAAAAALAAAGTPPPTSGGKRCRTDGGGADGADAKRSRGVADALERATDAAAPATLRRHLTTLLQRAGRWGDALYSHARAVIAATHGRDTAATRLTDDDVVAMITCIEAGLAALETAVGARAFRRSLAAGAPGTTAAAALAAAAGSAATAAEVPPSPGGGVDDSFDLDASGVWPAAAPAPAPAPAAPDAAPSAAAAAAAAASAALRQGRQKLGYINRNAHVNHLLFLSQALRDGAAGAAAPVLIVINNIDMFAQSTKQTLLYNLLDATTAPQSRLAMVGLSVRVDVVELLEKRLKSRFSHRMVSFPRQPLHVLARVLTAAAAFPPSMAALHATYARAWADGVAKTVAAPRFGLAAAWRTGASVRCLLGRLASAVHDVHPDAPVPAPTALDAADVVGAASGASVDAARLRLAAVPQLSTPQLCLLATMAHIELRAAREEGAAAAAGHGGGGGAAAVAGGVAGARLAGLYNFNIVYHEMSCGMRGHSGSMVGEAFAAAAADAGRGLHTLPVGDDADPNVAAYVVGRDVALLALQQLVARDLVRLGPRGVSTASLATAGSAIGQGGAAAGGPCAALFDDTMLAESRAELPYLPCKLLIDPAALLAFCAAPPVPLCATSAVLQWIRAAGKTAPAF